MSIIDEAVKSEGTGEGLDAVKGAARYISKKAQQDAILEIEICEIRKHENTESIHFNQPFFLLSGRLVEGTAKYSKKVNGDYVDFDLREGDSVSVMIELSSAQKASAKKWALKDIATMAAVFAEDGSEPDDFLNGGRRGPGQALAVFDDPSKFVGRRIHVCTTGNANKNGYYSLQYELVQEVKAKKSKKAS